MGIGIAAHELYFHTFLDRFNQRFGPSQPRDGSAWQKGGIAEIAALHGQFELFKPGRPFIQSASLLGLTGPVDSTARDRWLEYLEKLPRMQSDEPGRNGDERITSALAANLVQRDPLPCFMEIYDGRTREPGLVVVEEAHPVFFLESVRFLTIRLPARPNG